MSDLIERLEKAEVGSRDLDLAIERLTNISSVHDDHLDRFPDAAKPYTTSLDAIVGLIGEKLPGWTWEAVSYGSACLFSPDDQEAMAIGGTATTAPLALCIALLRSLKDSAHDR